MKDGILKVLTEDRHVYYGTLRQGSFKIDTYEVSADQIQMLRLDRHRPTKSYAQLKDGTKLNAVKTTGEVTIYVASLNSEITVQADNLFVLEIQAK